MKDSDLTLCGHLQANIVNSEIYKIITNIVSI